MSSSVSIIVGYMVLYIVLVRVLGASFSYIDYIEIEEECFEGIVVYGRGVRDNCENFLREGSERDQFLVVGLF